MFYQDLKKASCPYCGEAVDVWVDIGGDTQQRYVEDCPVCCNPNVLHVEIGADGDVRLWGTTEQDRY